MLLPGRHYPTMLTASLLLLAAMLFWLLYRTVNWFETI